MAETVYAPREWAGHGGVGGDLGGDTRTASARHDDGIRDDVTTRPRADHSAGWRDRHALGLVAPVESATAGAALWDQRDPRERGDPPQPHSARWPPAPAETMHHVPPAPAWNQGHRMENDVGGQWPRPTTTTWHSPAHQTTHEHVPPHHGGQDGSHWQSAHDNNSYVVVSLMVAVLPCWMSCRCHY
ncbi:hypothetical protein AMAG_12462 [Allomyces macrogynus ATCC 38327]|uniref:Uncharacterized protein n=1 Tax=Allomyces macrogynus (strain ATCC 38327) TaxID=578462 RepID=A0A0L0SZ08_ALLM3|nr:hypothetical protein AMAG_12462 [Allomyces macrogynus ATCC 38327]|eukprot:KNE67732.1 hypothetical protein AMAG_12462 [Allomyces macrogynus ATCC 38327]